VKKKQKIPELKLPCFRGMAAQLGPPELSMDDYYQAVVMIRQSMPCWSEAPRGSSERFVIREDDDEYSAKKQ
jgi:hypothetical protein